MFILIMKMYITEIENSITENAPKIGNNRNPRRSDLIASFFVGFNHTAISEKPGPTVKNDFRHALKRILLVVHLGVMKQFRQKL
jgi:hypothetical protein